MDSKQEVIMIKNSSFSVICVKTKMNTKGKESIKENERKI